MSKSYKIYQLVHFQNVNDKSLTFIPQKGMFTITDTSTGDSISFRTENYSQGITLTYFGFVSGETIHTKSEYFVGYGDCLKRITNILNNFFFVHR